MEDREGREGSFEGSMCASVLCEVASLRRGRRPDHHGKYSSEHERLDRVRQTGSWAGEGGEAMPEPPSALRSGVRLGS